MTYYQYEAGNCRGCGDPLGAIETRGGRHRQYCSDACKQAAYRKREQDKRNTRPLRNTIERELDQTLQLMTCNCGRGLWTVHGNVQIGHIYCTLCNSLFEEAQQ